MTFNLHRQIPPYPLWVAVLVLGLAQPHDGGFCLEVR
jgi:hypothetical protein